MPGPCFVDGDPVSLHTVESDDVEFYQRGWTEPALRFPLSVQRPFNREATESFLEEVDDGPDVTLLVCVDGEKLDGATAEEPVPVGCVSMFGVDTDAGVGDLAYWDAPEYQRAGYGTAAVDALVRYGFDERRLHRISAFVLDGNDASRGLLERLGFTHEGVRRGQTFEDGERLGGHVYGLLDREWRATGENTTVTGGSA
jgi:RimJ/RimL family protein N-acetyltransferase